MMSSPDDIQVEIADSGKEAEDGRFGKAFRPGVGIMGMQERVRQVGGKFNIDASNQGTTIRVSVPRRLSANTV
jgi:signal transduction histidine kinase